MSKLIKSIVISFVVLFSFFSTASYAGELRPIKNCGYEIFKGTDKTGTRLALCLHSRGDKNFVSLFIGKKKKETYSVSDIAYLHTVMNGVLERELINVTIPNTTDALAFGTFKSGKINSGELKIWSHHNVTDLVMLNPKTLKIHLTINGHGLEDYGIERRGDGARPVPSHVLKAPSM